MRRTLRIAVPVLLVAGAVVAAVVIADRVRKQRAIAEAAVADVEATLDDLDPVTRAAVLAKLAKDESDRVRAT